MLPLTQLLSSHVPSSSLLLTTPIPKRFSAALVSHHKPTIPTGSAKRLSFGLQLGRNKYTPLKCSAVSLVSDPPQLELAKPLPAEVSRTIMELSSVATLSTLTQQGGWPLGCGVRFAVDRSGVPVLCLNEFNATLFDDNRCSLHVQLEQSGVRTPQCTILGSLEKPSGGMALRRLYSAWNKRFNEEVDESLLYVINVERLLQIENFAEDGVWVSSSEYALAEPDPLRECAGKIVDEINTHNVEDVYRFCNIYVDLDFQVLDAKMVWVDRLGFDVHLRSVQKDVYEVRIPFPREVADEKGAKSSFNCMSQLAWEVEKNYHSPELKKASHLKKITRSAV